MKDEIENKGNHSLFIRGNEVRQWPPINACVEAAMDCGRDVTEYVMDVADIPKLRDRVDQFEEQMSKFIGYVMTCRKTNTPEWMEGLAEEINKICPLFNDRPCHYYDGDGIKSKT